MDTDETMVTDEAAADMPAEESAAPAAGEEKAPKAAGNDNADPNAKLFVGNLSWGTTNDSLRSAFTQFGEVVSAEVVMERGTGRSKGFGFVQMANVADANTAAEKMNGQMLDGRPLTVNIARPKTDKPRFDRPRYDHR